MKDGGNIMEKKGTQDSPFIKGGVRWNVKSYIDQWTNTRRWAPNALGPLLIKSGLAYAAKDGRNLHAIFKLKATINPGTWQDRQYDPEYGAITPEDKEDATEYTWAWLRAMRSLFALKWLRDAGEWQCDFLDMNLQRLLALYDLRQEKGATLTAKEWKDLEDALEGAWQNVKSGAAFNAMVIRIKNALAIPEVESLKQSPTNWPHLIELMNQAAALLEARDGTEYAAPWKLEDFTPAPFPKDWGKEGFPFSEWYDHIRLNGIALAMERGRLYRWENQDAQEEGPGGNAETDIQ